MRTRIAATVSASALAACALLTACNDPAPRGSTTPVAAAKPDPMEAKINALPPTLQRTTFFRAINDANFNCQTIVNLVARGRVEGKATWVAECDKGAQYVIELQPGGIFHVMGVPKNYR